MKNKFTLFIIITLILFLLSMLCFKIMKIAGELQGIAIVENEGNSFYYFNTIFGLIGLILYNIIKITYDKLFNKICKNYIKFSHRVLMWVFYIIISLIFWVFVFLKSNIGGGLTNLYMFKYEFLHGLYAIDILFILPLWNILYNIYKIVKNKIKRKVATN